MRIGLLAMSGIRVVDEELLRLGLTLPGFVERGETIASLPSLGLLTLAALTPSEHEVEYLEVPDPRSLDELPDGFDLVAISSYSAQILEAYDLADRYREAGVLVVMGGPHVTALPEEAAKHCDAVVVGEGEPCWSHVLSDCARHRPEGIYDARPHDYDLAEAPVPAFELLDISHYNRLTVQASRGCPHRCEFCASSVLLTDRYKQKPVDNVAREIDRILEIWDRPFIEFADDNALVNRAYWKELLARLSTKRLRWFAETDLSVARDSELLDLMRESGCAQVLIGLESPVEDGLPGLELISDWKRKRFPEYREAIQEIQSHGITVNGCFVIGLDGQTPEIFDQVFEFVRDSGLYEVQITILTPFPGTPLYDRLLDEGRILEPRAWDRCTLFDLNYRPQNMSPKELADGFKQLSVRLYSEEFTQWRRNRFKEALPTGLRQKGRVS
ncbi:MAG: radical SAM protein [Gemmatimonadetes bacterium]|nr:radical SAM protein [Gemmatimonadota bacterium]